MKKRCSSWAPWIAACALAAAPVAMGAVTVPGADGSDGIFNPNNSVTINLSQAATGAWDSASPVAGKGVYDPDKWAVTWRSYLKKCSEGKRKRI